MQKAMPCILFLVSRNPCSLPVLVAVVTVFACVHVLLETSVINRASLSVFAISMSTFMRGYHQGIIGIYLESSLYNYKMMLS